MPISPYRPILPPRPPAPITPPLTAKQVSTYRDMTRAIDDYASANVNLQPLGSMLEKDKDRLEVSAFDWRHPKGPLGLSPATRKELDQGLRTVEKMLATGRFGDRRLDAGERAALERVQFELSRLARLDDSLRRP